MLQHCSCFSTAGPVVPDSRLAELEGDPITSSVFVSGLHGDAQGYRPALAALQLASVTGLGQSELFSRGTPSKIKNIKKNKSLVVKALVEPATD